MTAIFQSFTVYPDGVGGVLTLTGVWALLAADDESRNGATRPSVAASRRGARAAAVAAHRFAVLAGGLGALVLLRLSTTKNPAAKAVRSCRSRGQRAALGRLLRRDLRPPDPTAAYGPGEMDRSASFPAGSPVCCSISGSDW